MGIGLSVDISRDRNRAATTGCAFDIRVGICSRLYPSPKVGTAGQDRRRNRAVASYPSQQPSGEGIKPRTRHDLLQEERLSESGRIFEEVSDGGFKQRRGRTVARPFLLLGRTSGRGSSAP